MELEKQAQLENTVVRDTVFKRVIGVFFAILAVVAGGMFMYIFVTAESTVAGVYLMLWGIVAFLTMVITLGVAMKTMHSFAYSCFWFPFASFLLFLFFLFHTKIFVTRKPEGQLAFMLARFHTNTLCRY